jgi:hypothetical protein
MDWFKIASNLYHMALVLGAAYVAAHPDYAWLTPVLQMWGQILPPPDLFPGMKMEGIPRG